MIAIDLILILLNNALEKRRDEVISSVMGHAYSDKLWGHWMNSGGLTLLNGCEWRKYGEG